MASKTKRGSLHAKTLDLLHQSDKTLLEVFQDTNLPFHWLRKLSSDDIEDPSVNRMQLLYEYLTGSPLEV